MENDYRITKLHGTLIGDNRIPDLPAGEKTKIFSSTNGKTAWVDIPEGGKSVSPCLNLIDMGGGGEPRPRTSITEEEKTNLEKGLYNSILYFDPSLGESGFYSMYFPEPMVNMDGHVVFSVYSVSSELLVTGSRVYTLTIGEKSSDGTYPITTSKAIESFFGSVGGNGIETIETSVVTHNSDGSYTYLLPHTPTSSPYILKTVDNGEASYYLMTGDSELSFGMRPIALTDSFFGGNFMVVSGTTATQRPTNFPPQPKSADNGKVLTVNNGYPSWETAGGAIPVVEVTLNGDSSITLPEAQTTNFIIHNEEMGYIYVNNIGGTYSAIIPVGKDDNSGNNQLALFSGEGTNLTLEVVPLGGGTSSGVIESFPFPQTINSEKGYNILSPIIDTGEIVYTGNAVTDNNLGNFRLMLGLSSNVVPSAQGEQEYCNFDCIVKDMGIGRMSLKKDSNNIPQFKSFTTWLPPVTTDSDGKALIVTGGNAQWTSIPRYKHTVTLKTSAGAILWTQTLSNSKNTPVDSYEDLKTLFGGELLAGYGEYCQLDLRGGTKATDKLIKADGTEAILESLGAIVYTDVCFLPK